MFKQMTGIKHRESRSGTQPIETKNTRHKGVSLLAKPGDSAQNADQGASSAKNLAKERMGLSPRDASIRTVWTGRF
jgi:hypothetical protein